jgi:acetyltransferase-like isoleucine patch superfamily enzyme
VPLEQAEPLTLEMEHFIDCVRTRSTPRTDGREGVRVLRVLDAAQRSMAAGSGLPTDAEGAQIHPTAVIDAPSEIGSGTKIWHFSHVLAGSHNGADCSNGQNVSIGPDVWVGDRCKIQNNVSIFKGVLLEDEVFCGPSCVFTNVRTPRAAVDRRDEFAPTIVRRGASLGANATIVCGVTLGEHCLVGAGAVVTRDVPPHALVVGAPARQVGWVSHDGERLGEDLTCPRSGRQYRLDDAGQLQEALDG